LSLFWSSRLFFSSDGLATGLDAAVRPDVADNEVLKRFSFTRGPGNRAMLAQEN
jgi:hypothetical protein